MKRMIDASVGKCIKFIDPPFKKKHSFFLEKCMLIGQNQCGRNIIPMPVNGLLVKLSLDPLLADAALAGISKCPEALLGDAQDRWQPLAVDTPDVRAAHDFHEWLEALPGVEQVDVIYVGFDELSPTETAP